MIGEKGDLLSHNLFAYCKNNPINMIDPDGKAGVFALLGGFAASLISAINIPILLTAVTVVAVAYTIYVGGTYIAKEIKKSGFTFKSNKNKSKENEKNNKSKTKKPKSGISDKEGAKDVPEWAKGNRPYVDESGKDFAKRLLDEKYGPGNYKTGPTSEFNKIKKWGDRSFE